MKNTSNIAKIARTIIALAASGLLLTSVSHAQNYYFDPNGTIGQPGAYANGSGSFNTSPFTNDSNGIDQTFPDGGSAFFQGSGGTVTVDAPISASSLAINVGSADETFGTPGTTNAITINMGASGYQPITVYSAGNLTFNAPIDLNMTAQPLYAIYWSNNVAGTTTFNALNFSGVGDTYGGDYRLSGNFVFNGPVTNTSVPGPGTVDNGITFGPGNSTLTSTASFSGVYIGIGGGTVSTKTANLGADNINIGSGSFVTAAPGLTITNGIQSSGTFTVGTGTADDATYTGTFSSYNGAVLNLTAAAGSTAHIAGGLYSTSDGTSGQVNKIGTGAVSIEGNFFSNGPTTVEPIEVQNGTLLLNSATPVTGSQITVDAVAPGSINANQTYATLGGNGSTSNALPVVAAGETSIIAPGDPEVNSGIGTLTLAGGLVINNGATLAFVINGANNSAIDLAESDFTPSGELTFTFANSSNILSNHEYALIVDMGGGSDDSGVTGYNIVAPYGYAVTNESFNVFTGDVSVEFLAAPEPSTYALMLGGLAVLGFCIRRRNAKLRA